MTGTNVKTGQDQVTDAARTEKERAKTKTPEGTRYDMARSDRKKLLCTIRSRQKQIETKRYRDTQGSIETKQNRQEQTWMAAVSSTCHRQALRFVWLKYSLTARSAKGFDWGNTQYARFEFLGVRGHWPVHCKHDEK